jgi:AraC family transcriptional regulator, positive regulator of tynA and feaB
MKLYSNVEVLDQPHTNHLYTLNTESFCIEVDPLDKKSYRATAEVAALGALTIARIDTNGAVVSRKNEVAQEEEFKRFSFVFAIQGDLVISHHLGMNSLKAGEFTLMDNTHPRTMFVYNQVSLLIVSVPRQVLQRYLPEPEEVEAQVLGSSGSGDARGDIRGDELFKPVLSIWEHMKKGSLREFAPAISENLLSNIAVAYSRHFRQQSSKTLRRIAEARQLIEAQLANPELTVEGLAATMNVSSRYLRGLFHGTEKLSHYILRRRLEESANQLASVLHQNRSITSIAFQCGFSNTAHFSRAFRKLYGMTPRDYRRQHLGSVSAA